MSGFLRENLVIRIFILFLLLLSFRGYAQSTTRFAVIGDFGSAGSDEEDVSNLIHSWNVEFIITVGDNNYPDGEASTIDENIGQYYHQYIYPYVGTYGQGADINRFFPSLGNHDWNTSTLQPHYDYFTLPNNERYYDFIWGDIHFFAIDSDSHEPDGRAAGSVQGQWLQNKLASSTSTWRVVYFHHAPYSSSSSHGSQTIMQWPFKSWGASVVMAGHDHTYERIIVDDFLYFVNGLGGRSIYNFGTPVQGSQLRYNGDYGAMLVEAYQDSMNFKFYTQGNILIDSYTIFSGTALVENSAVSNFILEQNYPNPFNPKTKIKYQIPQADFINLTVYNILGNEITTLISEYKLAGTYEVEFDATNLPSGVYFYTLKTGDYVESKKMILLK